jgi:hypothetical protein
MPTLGLIGVGTTADDGNGSPFRTGGEIINANTVILQDFIDAKAFQEISQESDFPTQDATTITLTSQTVHLITDAFTTTKNFIVQDGAVWTSFNQNGPLVTYSGSGTMFSGTNISFAIRSCQITCPAATAFAFTDTVVNAQTFRFQDVSLVACNKIGTFTGLANAIFLTGAVFSANDGITYAGTGLLAATIDRMFLGSTSASSIAVDLGTATIQNPEFTNLIVVAPSGAIGISGTTASANVPTGSIGMVANSSFSGGMTAPISGIAVTDFRWTFSDNTPIPDTVQDALLSFNGSSTETVISTQDVPVIVNATWVCIRESIFTCTTGGRATSDSERDLTGVPIDVAVGLLSAGGGTIAVTVYLAKNGSVITASATSISISGSNQAFVSIPWQETIQEDDFYEVFVENNTNTTNIIVESGKLRIR